MTMIDSPTDGPGAAATCRSTHFARGRRGLILLVLATLSATQGCLTQQRGDSGDSAASRTHSLDFLPSHATHELVSCRIEAELSPPTHELKATADLVLRPAQGRSRAADNSLYVSLNSSLVVESVELDGQPLDFERIDANLALATRDSYIATDEPTTAPVTQPADDAVTEPQPSSAPAPAEEPANETDDDDQDVVPGDHDVGDVESGDIEADGVDDDQPEADSEVEEPVVDSSEVTTAPADESPEPTSAPAEESAALAGEPPKPAGPVTSHRVAYYRIVIPGGRASGEMTLRLQYAGIIWQDVEAGEKSGEIHNFNMSAHIGDEGVYLSPAGAWYPTPASRDEKDAKSGDRPERPRTNFELTAAVPEGFLLTACGDRTDADLLAPRGRKTSWKSPFPLDGITLVGGPLQLHQKAVGRVTVSVHLRPDQADKASLLLDAVTQYITLYQPLIGPYPFREFTVVENFFSSGFAFPGYTVLASAVIQMGENGLRPGYLDHEMLHNWWGNGVLVSSKDGNWCECLTSFCTNYMHHVLADRPDEARAYRRDTCYGVSSMTPERDVPLDQFDREGDASRFIGYQKGAMVFSMLADRVGEKALWRSLKRLARERLGEPTTWDDIRSTIERDTARPMEKFFQQWVRGAGVPDIEIDDAAFDPNSQRLTISILQRGDRVFDLNLPIRITYENGTPTDRVISLTRALQVEVIPCGNMPRSVEIDPDFRVLRKLPVDHIMPTVSRIGRRVPFTVVRDPEDFAAYVGVSENFRERYDKEYTEVGEVTPAAVTDLEFSRGHVMLLGAAARDERIAEALGQKAVVIGEDYFAVEGRRYDEPQHALLCCINNPHHAGAIICCYIGNSEKALKRASLLSFYGGNSLIVFDGGKPVHRSDFERIQSVTVRSEAASNP